MDEKTIRKTLQKSERVTLECKRTRMVGYGENLGSGFPLTLDAWKQAGWDMPVLNEKLELDDVILILPVQRSTGEMTMESTQKSTLKSTQKTIIEIIMKYPNVTIPQVAQKLNLNPRGIAKYFKAFQGKGIIRRVGHYKGGHWEIIEEK